MLLTQLEYFVAVAREQHFGRAAAACHVSPSGLSEAIRKLEVELRVPLVRRGRAFEGLTPEGDLVLLWARRMLADHRHLRDELDLARAELSTTLRLGVIPSAVPHAADLVTELIDAHPLLRVEIRTGLATEQILAGLRAYDLDAGLVHPVDATDLALTPLSRDRLVAVGLPERFEGVGTISGTDLAELPLALLSPTMQARRDLDAAFADHGLRLTPRVEADSVEALVDLGRAGRWVAVVPALEARARPGLRVAVLEAPRVEITVALARLAEGPRSPVAAAVDAAAAGTTGRRRLRRSAGDPAPGPRTRTGQQQSDRGCG
ncbi:LysR family transcriptional regulator [Kineococcus gynurae]|uniref:LysR family transcriptional regulator n=1 Tax=Kineococcus gynurae TaxID=452979 RepID=UPI0035E99B30